MTATPAPTLNPQQARIATDATALLQLLDTTVPSSTVHYAVEDARRALRTLARVADGIRTTEPNTWTFVGHWENDRIVVEYIVPGEVLDDREDTGEWEQGLFASSASGATQEAAFDAIRDEYEAPLHEDYDEDEEQGA